MWLIPLESVKHNLKISSGRKNAIVNVSNSTFSVEVWSDLKELSDYSSKGCVFPYNTVLLALSSY